SRWSRATSSGRRRGSSWSASGSPPRTPSSSFAARRSTSTSSSATFRSASSRAATCLRPREAWLPLLDESGHRLHEVVGSEEGGVPHRDVVEALLDRVPLTGPQDLLHALDDERRVGRDLGREVVRRLVQRGGVGENVIDEPDLT